MVSCSVIAASASNDPIPGVDVIVEKVPPGTVVYRGSTDKTGAIRIKTLQEGQYRVRDRKGRNRMFQHKGGPVRWLWK